MASVSLSKFQAQNSKLSSAKTRSRKLSTENKELRKLVGKKQRDAIATNNKNWHMATALAVMMMMLGGAVGGQLTRVMAGRAAMSGKPDRSKWITWGSLAVGLLLIMSGLASGTSGKARYGRIIVGFLLIGIGGAAFTLKATQEDWIPGDWKWDPADADKFA